MLKKKTQNKDFKSITPKKRDMVKVLKVSYKMIKNLNYSFYQHNPTGIKKDPLMKKQN